MTPDRRLFVRAFVAGVAALTGWLAIGPVAAQPAQPQTETIETTFTYYYKDPRPQRLIGFIERYAALPPAEKWGAWPPQAGFLAIIFRKHPGEIDKLIPAKPNAMAAETLAAALQLSGQRAALAKYQQRLQQAGRDSQLAAEFAGLPAKLEDLRIATPTHLDILWGASFASGDGRYARMIIDFFAQTANRSEATALDTAQVLVAMMGGPKEPLTTMRAKYGDAGAREIAYAATALWALQSNARQHAFVDQVVTQYVRDNAGTPAVKAISATRPRPRAQ